MTDDAKAPVPEIEFKMSPAPMPGPVRPEPLPIWYSFMTRTLDATSPNLALRIRHSSGPI